MSSPPVALPVRRAARVLLVDESDRLLLFRSHVRPEMGGVVFWYPVGGAVEAGESFEEAAKREAREETGLTGLTLGPEVFRRRFILRWRNETWDAQERWWLARVEHFLPVFTGMEAVEIDDFADCRWMTVSDLARVREMGERLTPAGLLGFLPGLLAGEVPVEPIEVGE